MPALTVALTLAASSCALAALASPLAGESPSTTASHSIPIVIESKSDLSPCDSLGEVSNLDPHGDNFLSVQSGPGGKPYTETDQLQSHTRIHICGERGMWWAVVYGKTEDDDCHLARPEQKTYTYRGPCRFGWVHKRYVTILAG